MAEKSLFLRSLWLWLCSGNAAGRIRQATDASDPAREIQSFLQADKRRPACSCWAVLVCATGLMGSCFVALVVVSG